MGTAAEVLHLVNILLLTMLASRTPEDRTEFDITEPDALLPDIKTPDTAAAEKQF